MAAAGATIGAGGGAVTAATWTGSYGLRTATVGAAWAAATWTGVIGMGTGGSDRPGAKPEF